MSERMELIVALAFVALILAMQAALAIEPFVRKQLWINKEQPK